MKPYRRRKGKRGAFVGNFRVTVDGRDLNLQTKDADEAMRRARLAVRGHWPPDEAATRAIRNMANPAAAAGPVLSSMAAADPPAGAPVVSEAPPAGAAAPEISGDAATAERLPDPPSIGGLDAAVAAAAGEAAGVDADVAAARAERVAEVDVELAGIMGELTEGKGGGQLIDGVCDGVAAALLWAERKGVELGWKWTFQKPTGRRLVAGPQPEPGDLSRKCLRVGLKGIAIVHFPELAAKLTPGWAIAIGMLAGASSAVVGGQLVDIESGESQAFAAVAREAAGPAQAPPAPAA